MIALITLSESVGSSLCRPVGWVLCGCLASLVACQPLNRTGGPPAPSIGVLPAVTHETRVTLSGIKSPGSAIIVDGFQRVPSDNGTIWATAVDLAVEGSNTIVLAAMDDLGNLSKPLTVSIQRDTAKPAPPTISIPATSPTTSATNPFTIAGTKELDTFIRLNGRRITGPSSDTAWAYQVTLSPPSPPPASPTNTLVLTAVDAAGNESDPATVLVTLTGTCVAPPRPVYPLDGGAVKWGRAFSWTSQVGATSYRFELSASPAFDTFAMPPPSDLTDNVFEPDTAPPGPGIYYWRVGSVDASCTAYGPTRRVVIGSTTGDVTGDGFADVLVGGWADDRAGDDAGAAYLYGGGAIPALFPDAIMTGERTGDAFGSSVTKAGDIDRDGYEDMVVGALSSDRDAELDDNTGAAYLYWGGAAPATAPAAFFRGEADGSHFGNSVAGLGDVNGDGFPDVAVGAYQTRVTAACGGGTATLPGVGRVYVFFGGPRDRMDAIPDVVLTGETRQDAGDPASPCRDGDEFGFQIAGAGDVNGDGYDDLAVGARGFDASVSPPSGLNTGRAYVFFGGPWLIGLGAERADIVLTGVSPGDEYGAAVAGAGDTDGDGFADLLVGAPLRDLGGIDSGSVSWYFGPEPGGSSSPIEISGNAAGDNFGATLASAGDLNGDGLSDVVVGAYLAGPDDNGAASYFLGTVSRTVARVGTIFGQTDLSEPGDPLDGDWFGRSLGGVGDVDGNGVDDSVVGAPRHDACLDNPLFCDDAGRAYVIFGPTITDRGVASNPADWLLTGFNPGDNLGISIR